MAGADGAPTTAGAGGAPTTAGAGGAVATAGAGKVVATAGALGALAMAGAGGALATASAAGTVAVDGAGTARPGGVMGAIVAAAVLEVGTSGPGKAVTGDTTEGANDETEEIVGERAAMASMSLFSSS